MLKSEYKNVVINLRDIDYVEAMDNYVKVFRKELPTVISQITMKEMEELLPSELFLRVHRSYIVSLEMIDRFSNRMIAYGIVISSFQLRTPGCLPLCCGESPGRGN